MIISYIDSSLLLSILFNETHAEEALGIWGNCPIRVSSVLLKFETNISVRRKYKSRKNNLGGDWLETKLTALNGYFNDIFFTDINENLENSISGYYGALSGCRSLDAIHLAAALKISEKYSKNQICICSFDNDMRNLAQQLGFKVNDSR